MKKTKFSSFCLNGIADGCKYCVKGEKSVLFIGGKCSRNCWYCSLSNFRKKTNQIFINERPSKKISEIIEEIKESNSKGVGITGGDPLISFKKTLFLIKKIRENFGKNFHIHIYLPLNLLDEQKLRKLSFLVDEIRLHPSIFLTKNKKIVENEIEKIKMASKIFKKNVGIEIPCIPNKEEEIVDFILKIKDLISFVNLNEFEISETNQKIVEKNFSLNRDSYTIKNSLETGKKLLKILKKNKIKLKVHLCSAETKDLFQYRNRLLRRNVLPFGKKLKNGNVAYFCVLDEIRENLKKIRQLTKNYYFDKLGKRIILSKKELPKIKKEKIPLYYIEELPSYKSEIVLMEKIN
ncbi:MAG: 4Fe-4S cluster-binding domain-containing protein [Candidatus Pacearchaeota archaeon]